MTKPTKTTPPARKVRQPAVVALDRITTELDALSPGDRGRVLHWIACQYGECAPPCPDAPAAKE